MRKQIDVHRPTHNPRSRRSISCRAAVCMLVFLLASSSTAAVVIATADRQELSVGEPVALTVSVIVKPGTTVTPPEPSDTFGSLTLKRWDSKKHSLANADSIVFSYILTTYRVENCTIPSLPYLIETDSTHDTLTTQPIPLTIIPLCATDSADIRDLKAQLVTGRRPLVWLWLLLAAAAAVAGVVLYRRYFKRGQHEPSAPPTLPPYDEAMAALTALSAKNYPGKGLIREYAFELSDILKLYIERSYSINAAEFTTEEMLEWLETASFERPQRLSLEWFFRTIDPVKFARHRPDSATIERFEAEARSFLEATRPVETGPTSSDQRVGA